jgi:hypothetical protein
MTSAGKGQGPADVPALVLVVDVANVMGSRPDGWWRDRAGAAARLLDSLAPLVNAMVEAPGSEPVRLYRILAVTEGRARGVSGPGGVDVLAAPADGDTSIVAAAEGVLAGGHVPLVVTADRGLRDRLPAGSRVAGPGWLLALL